MSTRSGILSVASVSRIASGARQDAQGSDKRRRPKPDAARFCDRLRFFKPAPVKPAPDMHHRHKGGDTPRKIRASPRGRFRRDRRKTMLAFTIANAPRQRAKDRGRSLSSGIRRKSIRVQSPSRKKIGRPKAKTVTAAMRCVKSWPCAPQRPVQVTVALCKRFSVPCPQKTRSQDQRPVDPDRVFWFNANGNCPSARSSGSKTSAPGISRHPHPA